MLDGQTWLICQFVSKNNLHPFLVDQPFETFEDFVKVRLVAAIVVGFFSAQAKEAGLDTASAKLDWHCDAIAGDQDKNVLRGSSPVQSDGSNLMKKHAHCVKKDRWDSLNASKPKDF